MAITFVGASTTTAHNQAISSCPRPSGTSAGDILLCLSTGAAAGGVITPPAGWTLRLKTGYWTNNSIPVYLWWKVAEEGEPSDYTLTREVATGTWASFIASYRGVDTEVVFDNDVDTETLGSPPLTIPSIDVKSRPSKLLAITVFTPSASSTSMTQRVVHSASYLYVFDEDLSNAGATGPRVINALEGNGRLAILTSLRDANAETGPIAKPWTEAFIVE